MHLLVLSLILAAKKAPKPAERPYRVSHYAIALDLDAKSGAFTSTTTATVVPSAPASELDFDLRDLTVDKVSRGTSALATQVHPGSGGNSILAVSLGAPDEPGKSFELTFVAHGKAQVGGSLGLIRADDPDHPGRTVYYSMLEPDGARRIFPCDDRPGDKASFEISVATAADDAVISNGVQTADQKLPDGRHQVTWKQSEPMSTYLVAIAAGQFGGEKVPGTVAAHIWAAPGDESKLAFPVQTTQAALAFFADFLHTPYPWAKYDQVAIPDFPWHGMENTSATFERASALVQPPDALAERNGLARLIQHELAHQWFGDLVTPDSWREVWLNEAFATYLARTASTDLDKNDSALISAAMANRDELFRFADGPRARPLVSSAATDEDVFDPAAYLKGAAVLRMLETLVGRDTFRQALKGYLAAHAHANASSADFMAAVSSASGKNLGAFEKSWLHEAGYPVLKVGTRWLEGNKQLLVMLEEHPNKGGKKIFWPGPLTIVAHRTADPAYHLTFPMPLDQAKETVPIQLPAEPEWIDWNQGDVLLARIDADQSTDALGKQALFDPDPMSRLRADLALAGALANPDARDPKPPSDDAQDALARALGAEHSPYVRAAVTRELAQSPVARLPPKIGAAILIDAVSPAGVSADPLGAAELQKASYAALGKVDDPSVPDILAKPVADAHATLDRVAGAALGLGHRGDPTSIGELESALATQSPRGSAYLEAILRGLASVQAPSIAPTLLQQAQAHRNSIELTSAMASALEKNRALLRSPQGTELVARVAGDEGFNTEVRARWLDLLDDVKTPAARSALSRLAKNRDPRVAALAKQKLKGNFGK